jgi:hypothetical protein
MEKVIKHFDIDFVIKIPFKPNDKKLRLNEAVVYTVQEFLKNKPLDFNKFDQENNIDKMFLFGEHETQFDIIMSLNHEKSNIAEVVYDERHDDSYTAFDKTTKDKTISEKSGVMKDSILVKLGAFE